MGEGLPPGFIRLAACSPQAPRTIDLAMTWLENFPHEGDVDFVLKRLFGLSSLSTAQRVKCLGIAVPHLEKLGSAPETSHLLKGCLRDYALDPESARLVVHFGLIWIRSNPQAEAADFIFNRLLPRRDLAASDWEDISKIALAWLRNHTSKLNRDLSLAALLRRPEQLKIGDLEWVLEEARQWLSNPPRGARTPTKLLNVLNHFHQRYDPSGEMFPIAVLDRW